jgi:hypothetical protein
VHLHDVGVVVVAHYHNLPNSGKSETAFKLQRAILNFHPRPPGAKHQG